MLDSILDMLFFFPATSGHGDYDVLSRPVTFPNGSGDGAETCVSITVHSDNVVESEENFTVMLVLTTTGTSFMTRDNTSTLRVIVMDSDGMYTQINCSKM